MARTIGSRCPRSGESHVGLAATTACCSLTATLALLMLDRYLDFHFFTNDGGGNSMLYMNLIWVWGHPEVYILVLPAFGIYSEVVSTFSGKPPETTLPLALAAS